MNKLCTPVPHPETPEDYAESTLHTMINLEMLGSNEGLGFRWLRSSRLCSLYHMSLLGILKYGYFDYYYKKIINEKLMLLAGKNKN